METQEQIIKKIISKIQRKYKKNNLLKIDINMSFHITYNTEFDSILLFDKKGLCFCRLYYYRGEEKIYFDWLSVNKDIRKNKIATFLISLCENIAKELKYKKMCLWTIKYSWQHSWYKRIGFEDYQKHEDYQNCTWMQKYLNNEN